MCVGNPPRGGFLERRVRNCVYSPLVRSHIHNSAYIVRVKSMSNGRRDCPQPRLMVVDTGTADSYLLNMEGSGLPESSRKLLSRHKSRLPEFTIEVDGGAKIRISPTRYLEWTGEGGMVTNFHPGNGTIASAFSGNEPMILLGIAHIRGMVLDFDIENRRLGFANC